MADEPEQQPGATPEPVPTNPSWERVQLARHPKRPHALDYIQRVFTDFQELHGDRAFADDPAIVGGMALFEGRPVMIIGQQKGRDTKQKLHRNFGMPKPEGYRKAMRLMRLANKFGRPILTFLDTPGAYPGIDAEERGQAEAIAVNLREMSRLGVPIITVVIGEGGSGGALGLGIANRIYMLENAYYSVITPESCAAIIYRDSGKAPQAAQALRLTAADLKQLALIDDIVPEPPEGAHADPDKAAELLKETLRKALDETVAISPAQLVDERYQKFRHMGNAFLSQAVRSGEAGISRPAMAGIVFVLAILGALIYMSVGLMHQGARCEVCMEFNGRTNCKTVSGDTQDNALRTAISSACADIVSGVTETMQCEHSSPKSVTWK